MRWILRVAPPGRGAPRPCAERLPCSKRLGGLDGRGRASFDGAGAGAGADIEFMVFLGYSGKLLN